MITLYTLAVLIIAGLIFARVFGRLRFPDVTGYLVGGVLIGPYVLGLLTKDIVSANSIISEVALSFIAFSIGNEMSMKKLRKVGLRIIVVTIFEALGAFIVVALGCYFIFRTSLPFALVLGAVACPTAPDATLMVIRQYKAKGDLVDTLLPVVAMDDAVAIIAFGVCSTVAINLLGKGDLNIPMMILKPIGEIVMSCGLGVASGFLYSLIHKKLRSDEQVISFTIAAMFGTAAVAMYFGLSELMALMVMGFSIANLGFVQRRFDTLFEKFTPPIYIAFFVLNGADLNFKSLLGVGAIGLFCVFGRVFGKYLGAFFSTRLTGFPKSVQDYLGMTLVPQTGVSIGLSLLATKIIPAPHGEQIRTIILGAAILYGLVGPMLAKIALEKSGCIQKDLTPSIQS